MLKNHVTMKHADRLRFVMAAKPRLLNRRTGARALANFAIRKLGCDGLTSSAYADVLIDSMVHGASDEDLLERVRADLSANVADFSLAELRGVLRNGRDPALQSRQVISPRSPVPRFETL